MSDDRRDDELDTSTSEPTPVVDARSSVLTPMGQVESYGDFARGLGGRRVRTLLFVAVGLLMLVFLVAELS